MNTGSKLGEIFRNAAEEEDEDWLQNFYVQGPEIDEEMNPPKMEFVKNRVTQDEILRWASWTRPFPLPEHMSPTGGRLFDDIPDDVLLNAPPHLIVHLQRTAAQGGLQVISPRQTPFSALMSRTPDTKRDLGDHVVGSIASVDDRWPTVDNTRFDDLLPDEPLPVVCHDPHVRVRTRTEPLTRASHLMKDPILACLIKGRAVIDLQQRDDVMGDAGRLTSLLANAWSIPEQDLMDLDAFSLGIDGPLLRHAIKADDVYPMVHAPIHCLRSVSVGSNEVTREALPLDSAMDWRRMRVFCEAVYLMATSIEGTPLGKCRAFPPPGDPTAPLNRPNTLAFRPAPCVAWSFESRSFSIMPDAVWVKKPTRGIPPEVAAALARYTEVVRPISHVLSKGHVPRTKSTRAEEVEMPTGETITDSYVLMSRTLVVASARGKGPARAIRAYIYQAVSEAPINERLRIARYIHIAQGEVKTHLNMDIVPDELIHRLATNFLRIGETIRLRVAAEATRRCHSIEDWWRCIVAQVPKHYQELTEGTMAWAKVAMWLMFRKPTDKWDKLERTMHYKAVREGAIVAVGGVPLPPKHGSIERILQASRSFVKGITASYYGYYVAVADVGYAIADIMEKGGQPRSADILREGCYLWYLRARALRGTNVDALDKTHATPSENHLRVECPEVDLLVVPCPYRALAAYRTHVATSKVIHKNAKAEILQFDGVKISNLFTHMHEPLAPVKESVITRYLAKPWDLGRDMEKAWGMLAGDVAQVVRKYALEAEKLPDQRPPTVERIMMNEKLDLSAGPAKPRDDQRRYFDWLCHMDPDDVDWMEDMIADMPHSQAVMLQERIYGSAREVREAFEAVEKEILETSGHAAETVG